MKCEYRKCENPLTPGRLSFCSDMCGILETEEITKELIAWRSRGGSGSEYKKGECKFCMNSDHEGFCSTEHEREYDMIMAPIDMELGRKSNC